MFCIDENYGIVQDLKHIQVLIRSHEWIISLQLQSWFPFQYLSLNLCLWNNLNKTNVCIISRLCQFCFGHSFLFCFCCYTMYFSKLIHCRSGHCRPISISIWKLWHFFFFLNCVHCLTFKGKIITLQSSVKWNKVCCMQNKRTVILFFVSLNFHFILVSVSVG